MLHVHNHSLGKNRALPRVVPRLAASGYGMLLQIHDFAEDFRPENYRNLGRPAPEMLYPQASNVHYAVLNGRDRAILAAAGADPARLHLLPNPVLDVNRLPERSAARVKLHERFGVAPGDRYLLYPVRCIRRKNVGEALLLRRAVAAGDGRGADARSAESGRSADLSNVEGGGLRRCDCLAVSKSARPGR